MVEAYGLTETSPCIAVGGLHPGELRPGWVGRPLENLEVKIADDGELLVRGSSVMSGYWNKAESTAEAFDEGGFFRTGDIAQTSSDGFLRIVDRKKDLIVTAGGKNVAPQPIECRLKTSTLIDAAVLIGNRRPFIVALISPDLEELQQRIRGTDCEGLAGDELVQHPTVIALFQAAVEDVNTSLASFEQVKRFRVLPTTLSIESGHLTPTLKVKRQVVERDFSDVIDDLYRGADASRPTTVA
jgi:long-chain acyl-CoA synthetase